jgi:DNA mismatch endonuclease, patch repair protein
MTRRIDPLTVSERSARMARVRARDTQPELFVASLLRRCRFAFVQHSAELPGRPDFVFPRRRKVVFVHGCFWHQHPRCGRRPKTRQDFWLPKLRSNRQRDLDVQRELQRKGWKCLVLWECELRDPSNVAARLKDFLKPR